jgi:hypothetical protein
MAKTLLYRLFGIGKIPEQMMSTLEAEGIRLLDEGIRGSLTYINFRSPSRYSSWRRQWYTSSIALTEARLVGMRFSTPIINVPLTDERLRRMQFSAEERATLLVSFNASLFHRDWSGNLEYRFRTPQSRAFLDKLLERVGPG